MLRRGIGFHVPHYRPPIVEVTMRLNPGEVLRDDPFLAEWQKPPRQVYDWFLGLDLGQLQDYTAAALIRRTVFPRSGRLPIFDVLQLRRWELGVAYPAIVRDVSDLLTQPGTDGQLHFPGARLVVDATGVGKPILDLFRELPGLHERTVGITITGGAGSSFNASSGTFHVAKTELVGALQALRGQDRFRIAANVKEAAAVARELGTFSSKLTPSGALTFEAWRSGDKDDLVLAIVLPLWLARFYPPARVHQGEGMDKPLTPGRPDPTGPDDGDKWLEW